jgi:dTDP-4-amino-4,6-dideoxygalactose transaminase
LEDQRNLIAEHMRNVEQQLEDRKELFSQYKEKLKQMSERDIEYNKMLNYWVDFFRASYIYVPAPNDPIDKLLADFINKAEH